MMPAVPIRQAEEADDPALIDLWVAAWTLTMPGIDFGARRSWFANHLRRMLAAGGVLLVADQDGRPAGLALFDPGEAYLDQISIAPALQGRGIAQALMAEVKRRCPRGLHLWVNDDNPRAIAFYVKEGFRPGATGVNPNSGLPVTRYGWRPN